MGAGQTLQRVLMGGRKPGCECYMTCKHVAVQLSTGAQHIKGAVQGHYATHPSYSHLFTAITPVAKARHKT